MRISELLPYFNGVKRLSDDHYIALCPCHNDHKPSLDIKVKTDKILMSCPVCNSDGKDVMQKLGLDVKELFFGQSNYTNQNKPKNTDYFYSDTLKKTRFYARDKKTGELKKAFCWYHKEGEKWLRGLPKDDLDRSITPPLYKENNLTKAKDGTTVYIVEGEKDVDTMIDKLHLLAVSSPHGAGSGKLSSKWKDKYNSLFDGLNVAIIPDNDDAGRNLASYIAIKIKPFAKSVKILNLREEYPNINEKGDITDVYISDNNADITRDKLIHLTNITAIFEDKPPEIPMSDSGLITPEVIEKRLELKEYNKKHLPDYIYATDNDKLKLDEKRYIETFIEKHGVRCINGQLYSVDGLFPDGKAKKIIINDIMPFVNYNHGDKSKKLLEGIKQSCYIDPPKPSTDKIHFLNGTLSKDEDGLYTVFSEEKEFCINRLNVNYNPDAPKPERFLKYLEEVFHKDDQKTIQQYCGYCLIPTTFLQKALIIIGNGGEGKSVLGSILNGVIGEDNCFNDSVSMLEGKFGMANLENKLLLIDDDLSENALKNSSKFKKIVTNNVKISSDKKFVQNFEFNSYARLLIFGNFTLQSLYDTSEGFTRRQIVLQAKPKNNNRVDNPFLDKEIIENEAEGVMQWLLDGLNLLIALGYKLYISERTQAESDRIKRESDSVALFLDECSKLTFGSKAAVHSKDLYSVYCEFCEENLLIQLTSKSFISAVRAKGKEKGILYGTNIKLNNKRGRGFVGIGTKNFHNYYR